MAASRVVGLVNRVFNTLYVLVECLLIQVYMK